MCLFNKNRTECLSFFSGNNTKWRLLGQGISKTYYIFVTKNYKIVTKLQCFIS